MKATKFNYYERMSIQTIPPFGVVNTNRDSKFILTPLEMGYDLGTFPPHQTTTTDEKAIQKWTVFFGYLSL